jgi:integrase
MPDSFCPTANLVALRSHVEACPSCQTSRQHLIDLAVEILLATSKSTAGDRGLPNIIVINHQTAPAGPAVNPVSDSPLFREFVKARFEPDVIRHLKLAGRKGYKYLLQRHVMPVVGDCRLSEITFETVQDGIVQKMLDAGYAVQTARHVRQVMNAVFKHAVRTRQFAGTLPTFGIRFPEMKRKPRHALSVPQARAVIQAFKNPFRAMALVSMTTSMNLAEMCALRWKRLNLSAEPVLSEGEIIPAYSVAVRENFYQGEFGSPKTVNRKRCVALPQASAAALEGLRSTTRFSGPDDIVFATRNGTPHLASNLRYRVIKPVGESLGLPWLNWHCFRNTYATLGEQLGIALSDRQAQMGHGTVWMTQEYTVSDIERRRAGSEMIAQKIA